MSDDDGSAAGRDRRAAQNLLCARVLRRQLRELGIAPSPNRAEDAEPRQPDLRSHLQSLIDALEVDSPESFVAYACWAERLRVTHQPAGGEQAALLRQLETWLPNHPPHIAPARALVERARARATAAPQPSLEPTCRAFTQAILGGERATAVSLMAQALSAHPPARAYTDVVARAMIEVGERWQRAELSVADEHRASAVCVYVLAQCYPRLERSAARRGQAVVVGVEGEQHQLGAQMLADLLEVDGWSVMFLGTDLPHEPIVAACRSHQASLIAVSTTMARNLTAAAELVDALRSKLPRPPMVMVGGRAYQTLEAAARAVRADFTAPTLDEAVQLARLNRAP